MIASWLATGPPVMCWVAPARVCTSVPADRFWIAPPATSTTAASTDNGSTIRTQMRTRSTQKLPSWSAPGPGCPAEPRRPDLAEPRVKPRTSATATAIPTAAEAKFCTASPAICTRCPMVDSPEYHCQLVLVTKLTAVFQAPDGTTFGKPSDSHSQCCTRRNRYRNRTLTAEKASTLRAYTPQDCSPSGLTPISRYMTRSTRRCRVELTTRYM